MKLLQPEKQDVNNLNNKIEGSDAVLKVKPQASLVFDKFPVFYISHVQ